MKHLAMGKKAVRVLACFIDRDFTTQTADDNGSDSSPRKHGHSAGDVIHYGPWILLPSSAPTRYSFLHSR